MDDNIKGMQGSRNYKDWMPVKEDIQRKGVLRKFKEWEIWWCSIGENVGVEINGKGDKFTRPVSVYHKFSKYGFMGIPSTTKNHIAVAPDWYVNFKFKGNDEYAALHQLERVSVFRLCRKMGELDDVDIAKIKAGFAKLYIKNAPSG